MLLCACFRPRGNTQVVPLALLTPGSLLCSFIIWLWPSHSPYGLGWRFSLPCFPLHFGCVFASCPWFVSVNSLNSCWVLLQRWLHSSSGECDSWHMGDLVPCIRSCEAERCNTSRVSLSARCSPRRCPSLDIHFVFMCLSLVSSNNSLCSFPSP